MLLSNQLEPHWQWCLVLVNVKLLVWILGCGSEVIWNVAMSDRKHKWIYLKWRTQIWSNQPGWDIHLVAIKAYSTYTRGDTHNRNYFGIIGAFYKFLVCTFQWHHNLTGDLVMSLWREKILWCRAEFEVYWWCGNLLPSLSNHYEPCGCLSLCTWQTARMFIIGAIIHAFSCNNTGSVFMVSL